jgi:hypothetical protein
LLAFFSNRRLLLCFLLFTLTFSALDGPAHGPKTIGRISNDSIKDLILLKSQVGTVHSENIWKGKPILLEIEFNLGRKNLQLFLSRIVRGPLVDPAHRIPIQYSHIQVTSKHVCPLARRRDDQASRSHERVNHERTLLDFGLVAHHERQIVVG